MSSITTVTTKGQVVIPKSIREYFGLKPSSRVHFSIEDDKIILEPAESIASMKGIIKAGQIQPLSKQKMKRIITASVLKKHARNA